MELEWKELDFPTIEVQMHHQSAWQNNVQKRLLLN